MPIYEYECEHCGSIEEAYQKFSDAPLSVCKHCSGKLHKLMSHSTFHLKGSGWYVTDYAKKDAEIPEEPSSTSAKSAGGQKNSEAKNSVSTGKNSTPE